MLRDAVAGDGPAAVVRGAGGAARGRRPPRAHWRRLGDGLRSILRPALARREDAFAGAAPAGGWTARELEAMAGAKERAWRLSIEEARAHAGVRPHAHARARRWAGVGAGTRLPATARNACTPAAASKAAPATAPRATPT